MIESYLLVRDEVVVLVIEGRKEGDYYVNHEDAVDACLDMGPESLVTHFFERNQHWGKETG